MSLDEAWERTAAACKKHGKAFGGPTMAPEEMKKRHAQGAQLLVGDSEFESLMGGLVESVGKFEGLNR